MRNVLVACAAQQSPGGLEHLGPHRVLYDTTPDWAQAANRLLAQAAARGGDALFCDDDVTFTAGCLDAVQAHVDQADLFGLDLHDLAGARQAGARHTLAADGSLHDWVEAGPAYVAHVSTSAIYLTAAAVQALRFPVWPGVHWEDVALCLDAWLRGLRVMAVPGRVDHAIVGGVGATKRHDPAFWEKWATNQQAFAAWCAAHDVRAALDSGRIPTGARAI